MINSSNEKLVFFKRIDTFFFEKIDQLKKTPNYNSFLDFYNGLEEETQKGIKALVVLLIFLFPVIFLSFFIWQNDKLKKDLSLRIQVLSKANQIIGQKKSLNQIKFNVLSQNPIDSDSMLTSKLSGLLTSTGVDMTKIKISDFQSEDVSSELYRTQSKLNFNSFSTDELMTLITTLIQREKFKVSDVSISRNASSNLLQGYVHLIHLSQISNTELEE
jgi:hypothetical protein